MTLPASRVSQEFVKAMSDLLVKPLGELSVEQIRALTALTNQVSESHEPTPKSVGYATKVNDHTFTYRVQGPSAEKSQEAHIRDKLGEADAKFFIQSLKDNLGIDVSIINVPKVNEATLDINSNSKTRSEQGQLYEGGLADATQAINIALEAVSLAKGVDLDLARKGDESWEARGTRTKAEAITAGLDEGTATVLEKLVSGVIRFGNGGSGSGALNVLGGGRLFASGYGDGSSPLSWAFGARPAPESKN